MLYQLCSSHDFPWDFEHSESKTLDDHPLSQSGVLQIMHPKLEGSKLLHAGAVMCQIDDAYLEHTESA